MNTIDFLPQSYHEERARRNLKHRRWVLVLLTCLTLTGWAIARHKQSADLRWRVGSLESQVEVTQMKRSEQDKLRAERKALQYQESIQQQLDQAVAVTQAVALIGRLMPNSTALTNVRIQTYRPDPKPKEDPDKKKKKPAKNKKPTEEVKQRDYIEIEVRGLAPDDVVVANLVNTMSDHPLFNNVAMHFSRVDVREGFVARRFSIGAEVRLDRRYEPLAAGGER